MVAEGGNRETWRDWAAPGAPGTEGSTSPQEMLTRDELLATVERWGVKPVSERTLRFWEDEGVLPRATVEGEPGHQRAMYPWWVADLIAQVRQHQDRGLDLKQLPGRMRMAAWWLNRSPSAHEVPERPQPARATPPDLPDDLARLLVAELSNFGALHYLVDGTILERVDLVFQATNGQKAIYTLPLAPPSEGAIKTILLDSRKTDDQGGAQ